MAVTKIKSIKSTLNKALDYIQNPDKTDGKMLVSSFGCSYETADIEFEYTLSQALQKGNNLAFHLMKLQSEQCIRKTRISTLKSYMKRVQNLYRTIFVDRIEKSLRKESKVVQTKKQY